jgi:threonine/homoserine/homoserine lactone efflux protein
MIRRGLLPREQGGGFWATWRVGLGACTGDFLWALSVAAGAGVLLNQSGVRTVLGLISLALLLILAAIFSVSAWKTAHRVKNADVAELPKDSGKRGYLLGLLFALSSPWNIGFWLAVLGSQQTTTTAPSFLNSLMLACAVVFGASRCVPARAFSRGPCGKSGRKC